MNDNFSANPISSRREARRQRRNERQGSEWVAGVILIVVAIYLLLQNLQLITFNNWWAFFILLPAFGCFESVIRMYRQDGGKLTIRSRGVAIIGVLLTLVTGMFLFNISWVIVGPALLLLAGAGLLVNALLPS